MYFITLHPIYLRGKYYQFKYIRAEKYLTKKGVEKQLYIFEGSDSSVAILEGKLIAPPENSAKRKYKVIKVKKSKVYLSEWYWYIIPYIFYRKIIMIYLKNWKIKYFFVF